MARYAIKVVPQNWNDSLPLPFKAATRTYSRIETGMHVLIFQRDVGIVGDGEVTGGFIRPEEWTAHTGKALPPSLIAADYLLPLEAIFYRGNVIPPATVRQILSDPTFPPLDVWRPIDAQLYQQLIRRLM